MEMLPAARANVISPGSITAKPPTNFEFRYTVRNHLKCPADFVIAHAGAGVPTTSRRLSAGFPVMFDVALMCDVFEVFRNIVNFVFVLVVDLFSWRLWPNKRQSDQGVGTECLARPIATHQIDVIVTTGCGCINQLSYSFGTCAAPTSFCFGEPNAANIRDFVGVLETRYLSPFFFGHKLHHHCLG